MLSVLTKDIELQHTIRVAKAFAFAVLESFSSLSNFLLNHLSVTLHFKIFHLFGAQSTQVIIQSSIRSSSFQVGITPAINCIQIGSHACIIFI